VQACGYWLTALAVASQFFATMSLALLPSPMMRWSAPHEQRYGASENRTPAAQ